MVTDDESRSRPCKVSWHHHALIDVQDVEPGLNYLSHGLQDVFSVGPGDFLVDGDHLKSMERHLPVVRICCRPFYSVAPGDSEVPSGLQDW